MKMIDIITDIRSFLTSIHPDSSGKPRVFLEDAPKDAEYPFIVFSLPNSIDTSTMENFVLEIDFWNNVPDDTALETLCHNVNTALNRRTVMISNNISTSAYLENRLQIQDPDKRLRRRQYVYQLRVHGE